MNLLFALCFGVSVLLFFGRMALATFGSILTCDGDEVTREPRRSRTAFAFLLLPFALCACATGSPSHDVEKSLIAAHATYDGITIALQTATTTGVLHGSAAQEAQATYDKVGQELAAADAAWKAGNETLAATHVANATTAATKLCTSNIGCKPTVSNGTQ